MELLSEDSIKLLGGVKKDVDQDKDGEDVPKLESVKVISVHCNQQTSEVLFTFVPNKQFGQIITITPHSPTLLKTTNAEFSFAEVWFTDQNNRRLEIDDTMNITLRSRTG